VKVTSHALQIWVGISTYGLNGLGKGNGHATNAPLEYGIYLFLAATTVQLTRNKNKQQQSHLTTLNPGELETVNWVDQLQQVLSNTVALHFNGHIQVDLGRPVTECLHSGFYWS